MIPLLTTLTGLISGLVSALLIATGHPLLGAGLLLFSGLCDVLDGRIARWLGQSSPAGALLDIVSDRTVEAAVVVALFLVDPSRALLTLLMMGSILVCVTSFLVVGIFSENGSHKSFHYSPGLMERAEAFLFFTLMVVVPSSFVPLAILFVALVLFTALLRTLQFLAQARRQLEIER